MSALAIRTQTLRMNFSLVRAAFTARCASQPFRIAGASAAFVLTVGAILIGYRHCDCLLKQYDDAYITFRYAENLASGRGLVFNPGDPTDSASSFLYTLLLALCHRLGLKDLPLVASVLGIASAAGVASVVYLASLMRTRRPFLSLFLALAVSTHGLISGWAVSGMETLFFTCLVSISAFRLFICCTFGWADALLVLACMLTRFEGLLVAAVWFALGCVRFAHRSQPGRAALIQQTALIAGAFVAFLIFKYAAYGTIIPHAFALKTITQLYAPNPRALWDTWQRWTPELSLLALAGLFTLPRRIESAGFSVYCAASIVSLALGPSAEWARYSTHLLPLIAILASVPLSKLARAVPVVSLAACGLIAWHSYTSFEDHRASVAVGAGHQRCRVQVGEYLEHSLKPGTIVLSSDIGLIAYAAPSIWFIDAVGLTSKDVLEARERGQSVDSVLFAKRPVLIADTCGSSCTRVQDFAATNWLTNEGYWRTPLPHSEYSSRLGHGKLLDRCRSPDGLSFGVTRFKLNAP